MESGLTGDHPMGDISAAAASHSGTNDLSTQSVTVPGGSVGGKQMETLLLEIYSFSRNRWQACPLGIPDGARETGSTGQDTA